MTGEQLPLRRRLKRSRRKLGKWLSESIAPPLLEALSRTWEIEHVHREHLELTRVQERGALLAIWHGRMVLGLPAYAQRGFHVLVSMSGDGDVSDALLWRCGYEVIRGSSSRGGARALREMVRVLDTGAALVITPDGPRGPRHGMNEGLAWMARATGRAIVPLGFGVDRAWHTNSWDAFTIPKPFARLSFVYGAPIRVSREGGEAELTRATEAVRSALLACETEAFQRVGAPCDW